MRSFSLQVHRSPFPYAYPHGHGFAAITSWNLAGYSVVPLDLETAICPDSNGSLSVCKTRGENSGASSINKTPQCARVMIPGLAKPAPPPIRDAAEEV